MPRGFLDNVTSHDQNQVMSRVGIADLKANLSRHLRRVRTGRTLTVVDRNTPIAQLVPYAATALLEVRRATRKPRELRLPSAPAAVTDSLRILLEDRGSR
jgi:prevent-host-death family protein